MGGRFSHTAAVFVMTLAITGCARVHTVTLPQADRLAAGETKFHDRATIYVMRGSSRAGVMWPFPVQLDQAKVGSLRREEYVAFPASPGTHSLSITCASLCELPGINLNLEVTAGKTYFFIVDASGVAAAGALRVSSQVTQLSKQAAQRLLATYDPSDSSSAAVGR